MCTKHCYSVHELQYYKEAYICEYRFVKGSFCESVRGINESEMRCSWCIIVGVYMHAWLKKRVKCGVSCKPYKHHPS
jgi:hypothetical protein